MSAVYDAAYGAAFAHLALEYPTEAAAMAPTLAALAHQVARLACAHRPRLTQCETCAGTGWTLPAQAERCAACDGRGLA